MNKLKIFGITFILVLSAFTWIIFAGGQRQHLQSKSHLNRETRWTGNPLIPGKGVCDSSVKIFNGKFYLFATHYTPRKDVI